MTNLVSEHAIDFVVHGFAAGFAEMDAHPIGGFADLFHKGGLPNIPCVDRLIYSIFSIHR